MIKIISITDNPDGSATMDVEYSEEFLNIVSKSIEKKPEELTDKDIEDFIISALKKQLESGQL